MTTSAKSHIWLYVRMRHPATLDGVVVTLRASSPRRSSALPGQPPDAPTVDPNLRQCTRSRKRKNQRGSVSVEAALLVPLFVLVMSVAAAGWRVSWAHTQVAGAAQAAARAASLKGDAAQAHVTVIAIVQADLKTAGVHCSDIVIRDDVAAVAQVTGTSGVVSVGVQCTVRLGDLLVPGLPGSIVVNGQATEAIDTFSRRGR